MGLALEELLADFDPGPVKERTVAVNANKLVRSDLDVIRLGVIQGKVIGPKDVPLDISRSIVPGSRYTTPDTGEISIFTIFAKATTKFRWMRGRCPSMLFSPSRAQ